MSFVTRRKFESDNVEGDAEAIERGRQISAWFNAGLQNVSRQGGKNHSIPKLAEEIDYSKQRLYYLRNGSIDSRGKLVRPQRELIRKIATALDLDVNEGMRIMGYDLSADKARAVPDRVLKLPPSALQLLGQFIGEVEGDKLSDEAREIGALYDDLTPEQKIIAARELRNLHRRAKSNSATN